MRDSALRRFSLTALAVGLGAAAAPAGQGPGATTPVSATAEISGRVIRSDTGAPLPGACVSTLALDSSGQVLPDSNYAATFADDQGHFGLTGLSPGRHPLFASLPHFVGTSFGPDVLIGQPITILFTNGPTVNVTAGQRAVQDVALTRAPMILGVVRDRSGTPISGVRVSVWPIDPAGNGTTSVTTDAIGRFAVSLRGPGTFGLVATETTTSASSDEQDVTLGAGETVQDLPLTVDESTPPSRGVCTLAGRVLDQFGNARTALVTAERVGHTRGAGTPGSATVSADPDGRYCFSGLEPDNYVVYAAVTGCGSNSPVQQPDGRGGTSIVSLPRTFYPSAVSPAAAAVLPIDRKSAIDGLDIIVVPGRAAMLNVSIDTGGRPAAPAVLLVRRQDGLLPSLTAYQDGGNPIAVADVVEGNYSLLASASAPDPKRQTTVALWGTATIVSDGTRPIDERISLQPGARIVGQAVLKGSALPASPMVSLVPIEAPSPALQALPWFGNVTYDAQGRFTIDGVLPGQYVLRAEDDEPAIDSKFTPVAATSAGQDILDLPLDLAPGSVTSDVVLTLADHLPTISGRVDRGGGGPPAPSKVVVFPRDERYWWPGSRRVQTADVKADGSYSISVPPGDYLVALVEGTLDGDWPSALPPLEPLAVRIAVGVGEQKTLDLRRAGGG